MMARAMSQPVPAATREMLQELVHQFSDPFAFYRELVQNAIDAGSERVEISLRFEPALPRGLATVQVQDWGEGMNREVIERFLLTKFRSSKEKDPTKIGKFGIGFMSVFAPGPELVVVETGRGDEAWRLLLHPDHRYELLRRPEAMRGTRVVLHKELSAPDYSAFVKSSFDALRRWCRHSEVEISFAAGGADGSPPDAARLVREPFTLDAPFAVEYRDRHTQILAGPSRIDPPTYGFYNRGLTLLETQEPFFPGVTLKVISSRLEHTLTRDNVRRDASFERVLASARKLIDGPLMRRLPGELRRSADGEGSWDDYLTLLSFARTRLPPDKLWLRQPSGPGVQGKALRRARRALLFAHGRDPLVDALLAQGTNVLLADSSLRPIERARESLELPEALRVSDAFAMALRRSRDDAAPVLCLALQSLLDAAGCRAGRVQVGEVLGAGARRLCVCVEDFGRPAAAADALRSPFASPAPALLCLNGADRRVARAIQLAATGPHLAALLVFRLLALRFGRLDEHTYWKATETVLLS